MGNGGGIWVSLSGLIVLGVLAFTGLVGGLVLANNGHEVPAWLSGVIVGLTSNLGVVILFIYKAGAGNGSGSSSNGTRTAGPAGTSVSTAPSGSVRSA